jgi:hypothetical protein
MHYDIWLLLIEPRVMQCDIVQYDAVRCDLSYLIYCMSCVVLSFLSSCIIKLDLHAALGMTVHTLDRVSICLPLILTPHIDIVN